MKYNEKGELEVSHPQSKEEFSKPKTREEIILKQGHKDDSGKPHLALWSSVAIEETGKVLTFGANKYSPYNWRKGMSWVRVMSACLRHIFAWLSGQDKDPETGLSHLGHAMCCLMFLMDYEVNHPEFDDRYKGEINDSNTGVSGVRDNRTEGVS